MEDTEESGFPKYQYTLKHLDRGDALFTVRCNDFEEFKQLIRNIAWIIEHIDDDNFSQPTPTDDALTNYTCKQCGAPADFRAGKSRKTGESYRAIICTADKNHIERLA